MLCYIVVVRYTFGEGRQPEQRVVIEILNELINTRIFLRLIEHVSAEIHNHLQGPANI